MLELRGIGAAQRPGEDTYRIIAGGGGGQGGVGGVLNDSDISQGRDREVGNLRQIH